MNKNWILKDIDPDKLSDISGYFKINSVVGTILLSRGIESFEEINSYLFPRVSDIHSPFLMSGMSEAVELIKGAIRSRKKIGLFSDSDLDGITSLTILYNLFKKNQGDIYCRYPTGGENYGLTKEVIDDFHQNNIDLLITSDSGIRDIEEIAHARKLGIDVIVTDHHEQDEVLPDACIINPKINDCSYPFKNLAGVGVAFKLSYGLLFSFLPVYNKPVYIVSEKDDIFSYCHLRNGIEINLAEGLTFDDLIKAFQDSKIDDTSMVVFHGDEIVTGKIKENLNVEIFPYIDFIKSYINSNVTINSDEDLYRFFKFNKEIDKRHIEVLKKIFIEVQFFSSKKINEFINSSIGFVTIGSIADIMPLTGENRALVKKGIEALNRNNHPGISIINQTEIDTKSIGWNIAPFLNTPGRFGRTELSVQFLQEENPVQLKKIINEIDELNTERKEIVQSLVSYFLNELDDNPQLKKENVIFVRSDKIPNGLAGLIANRISESEKKPVIVISEQKGEKYYKGSGRSSLEFNFFSYIEKYASDFKRLGGHQQAFGFSVSPDKIDYIIEKITAEINSIEIPEQLYSVDAEISISDIAMDLLNELRILEPYGKGNEIPLFLSRSTKPSQFQRFGKNNVHGKFIYNNSRTIEAIGWNLGDEMETAFESGREIDLLYNIEINQFRGNLSPRIMVVDFDVY